MTDATCYFGPNVIFMKGIIYSCQLVSMSVYQSVSAFKSQICFTDQDTVMLHYHSKVHFNAI